MTEIAYTGAELKGTRRTSSTLEPADRLLESTVDLTLTPVLCQLFLLREL